MIRSEDHLHFDHSAITVADRRRTTDRATEARWITSAQVDASLCAEAAPLGRRGLTAQLQAVSRIATGEPPDFLQIGRSACLRHIT
jgi:hypothetical protein